MDLGLVNISAITVLAYLVGMAFKASPVDDKWIPIICGAVGLVLGLIGFYIAMPDMPAQDPITAAAIGVASGLAATGIDQIRKQLTADKIED